jgi:hypothetical protein
VVDDVVQQEVGDGDAPRRVPPGGNDAPWRGDPSAGAWWAYWPAAKSPAGALVQAIRDAWPPPQVWAEARERAAAVARHEEERRRREEDEARRWAWAAKPPEELLAGLDAPALDEGRAP